jgi:hypothetical protein
VKLGQVDRLFHQLELIYEAYPRKVGRPNALRAIYKAVTKYGVDRILDRTKAYALARAGEEPGFTPYPAVWFNQERFEDDPSTWKSNGGAVRGGNSELSHRLQIETEQKNLRVLVNESPANPESVFYQPGIDGEEVEKLKKMRRRMTEITRELARVKS